MRKMLKDYKRPAFATKEYWGWWDEDYEKWVFESPEYSNGKLVKMNYVLVWSDKPIREQ